MKIHSLALVIPYTPGDAGACARIEGEVNEWALKFLNGIEVTSIGERAAAMIYSRRSFPIVRTVPMDGMVNCECRLQRMRATAAQMVLHVSISTVALHPYWPFIRKRAGQNTNPHNSSADVTVD